VLDIPFAVVFLLAIFFLDSTLSAIASGFIIAVTVFCYLLWWGSVAKKAELDRLSRRSSVMIEAALSAPETIRFFGYSIAIRDGWKQNVQALRKASTGVMDAGSRIQAVGRLAGGVLTVVVVSVGAQNVVYGDLSIGALIGINILAVRALGPIMQLGQLLHGHREARDKVRAVDTFSKLPTEVTSGVELNSYKGSVQLRDVGFRYADSTASVFEAVNLDISGGQVLVVTGPNGSGKTTLARLFTGALQPTSGSIIADGVNLAQIQLSWWRKSVMYLPQEPRFIDGSIRENFSYYKPEITDGDIRALLEKVGLGHLVEQTSVGVDRQLHSAGANLSLGMRRRLALARALTHGGPLAVFDEPTEGMDSDGKKHVYSVLNELASGSTTIICCSHDVDIIRGAHHVVDLGSRPIPRIATVAAN
jgi:ATP-binding cassette subfamily C protein LapB